MRIYPETTPEDLYPQLLEALNHWHSSSPEHLLDFLLLVRERYGGPDSARPGDLAARRRLTNEVLEEGLDELEARTPEDAAILRRRFIDQEMTVKVSHVLNLSVDQVNRRQKTAVRVVAGLLLAREQGLRRLRAGELEARLPSRQYSALFGVDAAVRELSELLLPGRSPWVIALSGIGGIGKTALAHHLALGALIDFGEPSIHWVHTPSLPGPAPNPEETYRTILNELAARLAGPEGTPEARREQVRYILKTRPHLVVVDNLESEGETAFLYEQLFGLAEPSKFLLTTRAGMAGSAGVHILPIPELNFEHSAELVRDHSREMGMGAAAITAEDDLHSIYTAAGGNPLALKLVVGMAAGGLPLPVVLADLGKRQLAETDKMYDRIYQRAWEALSEDARELLEGMPLVSETGGGHAQLLAFSGLKEDRFWTAIRELLRRSLLEVRGTVSERRYGIHPLTRAFLQTKIIEIG
jgi:hypothetical protein